LADADGRVDIQIRDLDQTVIGNPAHDLIRLGLSLASAVRGSDLPGVTTARIIEQLIAGYETALMDDAALAADREPELVKTILKQAVRRRWRHLAMERLEGKKPALSRGNDFWPLSRAEQADLADLFEDVPVNIILGFASSACISGALQEVRISQCRVTCANLHLPNPAVGNNSAAISPRAKCLRGGTFLRSGCLGSARQHPERTFHVYAQ
jgi:hypothetical protein